MHVLDRNAVRAEALFLSLVQPSDPPDATRVRQAVAEVVRRLGRCECAAQMAQEYGDHPDVAARRMRWARTTVAAAFPAAQGRWPAEALVIIEPATGDTARWPVPGAGPAESTA